MLPGNTSLAPYQSVLYLIYSWPHDRPKLQIAKINGTGSVGFESCIFNAWNETRAAIQVQ